MKGASIVLGVTGGIAAYKAADLASRLTKAGAQVDVVLTRDACRFVSPLTFQAVTQRPVYQDMFESSVDAQISHVALAKRAEALVVAPATAHTLARFALGLADDLLCATALATRAPLVLAPAMEEQMYLHPATQEHLATLRKRGASVVGPGRGHLASGAEGLGRMAEPEEIVGVLRLLLGRGGPMAGVRLLVTAGGTQEPIDPVRFIGNRSSGKMGYAIAAEAAAMGGGVTLVSAPTALTVPPGVDLVPVQTADEMSDAVMARLATVDVLVMAAAVADYRVGEPAARKLKRTPEPLVLDLVPTVDILRAARGWADGHPDRRLLIVGFAAETGNLLEQARAKLAAKRLDIMVGNDVSKVGSGFGAETNEVIIIDREGGELPLPVLPKAEVARRLLAVIAAHLEKRR